MVDLRRAFIKYFSYGILPCFLTGDEDDCDIDMDDMFDVSCSCCCMWRSDVDEDVGDRSPFFIASL